jgi:hypothetical protein
MGVIVRTIVNTALQSLEATRRIKGSHKASLARSLQLVRPSYDINSSCRLYSTGWLGIFHPSTIGTQSRPAICCTSNITDICYSRSPLPLAVVIRYAIRLRNHRPNLLTRHQSINIRLIYLGTHCLTMSRSISPAYLDKDTAAWRTAL